jgi:putative ABC transport system permease protein
MPLDDFRYAVRTLRKTPGFTVAAALTVALGIAATTSIFSVVNAVILRALPYPEPGRLMQVAEKNDKLNLPRFSASVLNYLSWKEQTRTFESLAAIGYANFNLVGHGEPEQYAGNTVSPSIFPLLGIRPVTGRYFHEGEDRPGGARVVMISEGLWRRRFGGDRSLIGKSLALNGVNYTLVGVAPAELPLLTNGDVWVPLIIDPGREIRLNHVLTVIGRLKRGVAFSQAQAEMDTIASRMVTQYPEIKDWGIRLVTFRDTFVSDGLRTALWVMLGAVGCVLLIACANVANLLLSRAAARQKEIAVRMAIGASRGRLMRQLLSESLTLSLLGGAAGMVAAVFAIRAMNTLLPPNLLPVPVIPIDSTVMLFAFGITLATGLLFGLAPAWHAARTDLNDLLKHGGRSGGGARPLVRNSLVAAELALATVLLIGAGLMIQSLFQLQRAPLGFQPENLLTFQLTPPASKYAGVARGWAFYRELLASLETLPGVRGAALSSGIPLGAGNYTTSPGSAEGGSLLPAGASIPIEWRIASPGYFRTMGIPLLRGRTFSEQDDATAPPVAIITQETARKLWGDQDPLGRALLLSAGRRYTVAGVAGGVRSTALNQEPAPAMYIPSSYRLWPLMDVVVRAQGKPEALLPAVRRKVRELDPEMPLSNVRTMEQWISNGAAQPRLNATLLGIFAFMALAIASIGVYGVLAYSVTQRVREIGLRMALGAQRGAVLSLVVWEGMPVALAGIGAGLAGAWALSRLVATLLFGVRMRDPLTYAAVAAALALVALAACAVPAYRASRVDPMAALREE